MADPTRPAPIEDLLAHADWLRALARRLVSSDDLASDVEQETWLAAIEHPPRDASAPRKWLAGVLRNIVKEQRRGESARHAREARVARPEAVAASDESVERAQSLRALIEVVLELDEPYRSTLLLRYQDGLSPEEIANQQRVPASTVRNRISRGLALLRERLERRHGSAWSALLLPLVHHDATVTASIAALISMTTLKVVSAAAAVLIVGASLWWTLSDAKPSAPHTTVAQPEALVQPTLSEQAVATSSERAAVEAPKTAVSPPNSAQPATRGSLVVTVNWESDGSPASDVFVRVQAWGESSAFALATSRATDAQGRARFDNVAGGLVTVELDRAEGDMAQVSGAEVTEVALKIARGVFVRGRVVDSAGAPVGFARIWLSAYANGSNGDEMTTADASGRFTVRDVGESRRIAARAAGFAPSLSAFVRGRPGDEVDVVIELPAKGGELRGIVRAPDGSPLAGAAVLVGYEGVSLRGTNPGAETYSPPPQRLVTDQHGEFIASGLTVRLTNVECRARDFAPFVRGVDIAAEGVTNIAIDMQPGAAVAGVVLGSDGNPASKVLIDIGTYARFASSHTSTASDGSFRLDDLAPGETSIRVGGDQQGEASAKLKLIAGETAHLTVQLVKHGIVAGRVIDESGAPLVGWRVEAIPAGLRARVAITDADGKFMLDNWPEQANALELREANHRNAPPALIVHSIEIGRTDLVFTVPAMRIATATIVGRLRGPAGEVVADSKILWGERGGNQKFVAEMNAATGEFRAQTQPGNYELQAQSPSMGTQNLSPREVHVGETLDLGVVQFAAPSRVRVKLVGPRELFDKLDRRSISVDVLGPGRLGFGQIELDDKLEGRSVALAAGPYSIEVRCGVFRVPQTSVTLIAGEERTVEIAVERGTSRSLKVIWSPGAPPKELFEFVVTDAAGQVFLQTELPAADDAYTLVGLPGLGLGTYSIDVKTTDGRSAHVSFTVGDLAESTETIDVPVR